MPWKKKEIENDPKNAKIYVCPGDESVLQTIANDWTILAEALEDFDHFDSEMTSYSGRNQKDHKLDFTNRSSQLIVSDDDEDGLNHPNLVNVLYMDGTRDRVLLDKLEGEEFLVGEEAPLEEFRVLTNE
jgi:hypothetical protein